MSQGDSKVSVDAQSLGLEFDGKQGKIVALDGVSLQGQRRRNLRGSWRGEDD